MLHTVCENTEAFICRMPKTSRKQLYACTPMLDVVESMGRFLVADMPDHLIHLNGDKFFGPRGQ